MSVLNPRIPVTINLYREDLNTTTIEAIRTRSTPVDAKRRSVTSMKGLLPLALPNSCNNPSNNALTEGTMEAKIDEYLPEMLARDLEISSAVFAAKNMTAGTPAMSLVFDDEDTTMPCPGRILISPYPAGLARVQTLGAIEERHSLVSFTEHQLYISDEASSDVESISGTEASGGIEPPSIRLREQSIVTAATSLTSNSGNPPSPKDLMSLDRSQGYSWIDIDSDDDGDLEEEVPPEEQPGALSPRPPSPPSFDSSFFFGGHSRDASRSSRATLPQKTRSNSGGPLSLPCRKHSVTSIDIPLRGTSLSHTTRGSLSKCDFTLRTRESRTSIDTRHRTRQHSRNSFTYDQDSILEKCEEPERKSYELDDKYIDLELEEERIMNGELPPLRRPNTIYLQESPPLSPLPSVQAWLDESNAAFPSQSLGEDLAKAVPLPPDIIETLRVSIACFPETMLLSSSLTIETIRTYSRKVRQPSHDVWRDSLMPDPIPHHHRKSIWRKVVSHGRESLNARLHRTQPQLENDDILNRPSQEAPSPWSSLRHIFRNCSEYICDALYAHIVAYNYISRIPRPQPPQLNRASVMVTNQSQKEDIPKKAATLLGLGASQPQQQTPPAVGRFTKKLGSPLTGWGFGKDHMSTNAPPSAQLDNTTRNIESGLMRCIVRLIATAKMMSKDNPGEEKMVDVEPSEVDLIFVRSLCEIVRIAEEAA